MEQLQFVALPGSLRRLSCSRAIANTLDEIAPDSVQVITMDPVGDLPHFSEDVQRIGIPAQVLNLAAALRSADALVIVTPEYNYSIPGALKNALDWLSRVPEQPLAAKPVAIQTVSSGCFGGIRAQCHLRQVLVSLDADVLNDPEIMITNVTQRVDADTGLLRHPESRQQIAEQLKALQHLVHGRRKRLI